MGKPIFDQKTLLLAGLALLMAATRFHHFGDALHLPDASLAIFLMAGFFLPAVAVFPVLLLEAGAIDYAAVTLGGVSDWCITPAYWFLIPTYGAMWLGGRLLRRPVELTWKMAARFFVTSLVCTTIAFILSNGAFYLFSGRFPDLRFVEYWGRVAQYYPPYAISTLSYLCFFAFIYTLVQFVKRARIGNRKFSS
jgi:hypothetical protein